MPKHKLIAFAAALMSVSSILAPAACADGLVIPDIPAVYENIKLLEADGNIRMYYAEDGDQALEGVKFYAYTLFELYDFDSLAYDTESSDSIIYLYIKYYYGDADIESEYMDDCPEPCYALFALTGYDEGVLIVSCVAYGIIIGDISSETAQTETTAYAPPVAGNNGLLVMPMEEYFDGIELSYMFMGDSISGEITTTATAILIRVGITTARAATNIAPCTSSM